MAQTALRPHEQRMPLAHEAKTARSRDPAVERADANQPARRYGVNL